jgi:uncharacterized protein (UPF0335 family)
MSNTTTSQELLPLNKIDILEFGQMLSRARVVSISDAIIMRHHIANMKAEIKRLEQDADETLMSAGYEDKAIYVDADGNRFAVKLVKNTVKHYEQTPELLKVIADMEAITTKYDAVRARTKYDQMPSNFYYKVCKP